MSEREPSRLNSLIDKFPELDFISATQERGEVTLYKGEDFADPILNVTITVGRGGSAYRWLYIANIGYSVKNPAPFSFDERVELKKYDEEVKEALRSFYGLSTPDLPYDLPYIELKSRSGASIYIVVGEHHATTTGASRIRSYMNDRVPSLQDFSDCLNTTMSVIYTMEAIGAGRRIFDSRGHKVKRRKGHLALIES